MGGLVESLARSGVQQELATRWNAKPRAIRRRRLAWRTPIDVELGGSEREDVLERNAESLVGHLLRLLAPYDEPVGRADRHHLHGRVVPRVHEVDGRHAVDPTPADEIGHEQAFEDRGMHEDVGLLLLEEGIERRIVADSRQHPSSIPVIGSRPRPEPARPEATPAEGLAPEREDRTLVTAASEAAEHGRVVETAIAVETLLRDGDCPVPAER